MKNEIKNGVLIKYNGEEKVVNFVDRSERIECIGEEAFHRNRTLEQIYFANPYCTRIGDRAFRGNSALKTVYWSEAAVPTSIGSGAFSFCSRLKKVRIPEGLIDMGNGVFHRSGLESIDLPTSLEHIGAGSFSHCRKLRTISVSRLFNLELLINQGLKGDVEIRCTQVASSRPDHDKRQGTSLTFEDLSVNSITVKDLQNEMAKHSKTQVPQATINEGVLTAYQPSTDQRVADISGDIDCIGSTAFNQCDQLTTINLLEGVKRIRNKAFQCRSLHTIALPESLAHIGDDALRRCPALKTIIVPENFDLGLLVGLEIPPEVCIEQQSSISVSATNLFIDISNYAQNILPGADPINPKLEKPTMKSFGCSRMSYSDLLRKVCEQNSSHSHKK